MKFLPTCSLFGVMLSIMPGRFGIQFMDYNLASLRLNLVAVDLIGDPLL